MDSTVKVKVKVTLEHAMKAQRGSRGIALLFLVSPRSDNKCGQYSRGKGHRRTCHEDPEGE